MAEQIQTEPELNKHTIIRNLHQIADADIARDIDELQDFLTAKSVLRGFQDAISLFGNHEEWTGSIYRGFNGIQSKYLSVRVEQPPFLEGGSYLHAYSTDAGQPAFGVLLPFEADGRLDRRRSVSAKWMMDPEPVTLAPYQPLLPEYERQATERISWITQMAATDLASFIDTEWPSTLDEQLAAL